MNRKDIKVDRKKVNTADFRRKEKENKKLQLELNQEREKYSQMVVKYQKDLNEMQAVRLTIILKWILHVCLGLTFKT